MQKYMIINVIKVVVPSVLAFFLGILITPFFTNIFYKYRMWKKNPRTESKDITTDDFAKVHNTKGELSTPRVGGIIIWMSVLLTILVIYLLSIVFKTDVTQKLNFLSRNQTLVPLTALILASLIGLIDDMLQIIGKGSYAQDNLIYRKIKIIAVALIGLVIGFWFYNKLGATSIHIPFGGNIELGLWFIPFFIIVMLAVFSSSVIDGIDGLSGGIMAIIFTAYAVIAFVNNQIDIAAFCAVISGGTLAFLWFNIPPARFYMGETGILGLTVTLSVIAFMTNSVMVLPIIALPLVLTSASVIIQMISYKYFNKHRVFRVAPLHHHFEAIGWSKEKVVMRYWIVGVVFAIVGVIIALVS
jgi:phospho-N-acetylmuramoyl-pentapeptide-transferase